MTQLGAVRERYLRDGLNIRLGGLAANLARICSFSSGVRHHEAVARLFEESKWFIEWNVPDAPMEMQAELVELQIQLAVWHRAWRQGDPRMSPKEIQELLDKARRSLHAAERLLDEGDTDFSVIAAFNEHFVKTGEVPARLFFMLRDGFEDRAEGDYGLTVITEEQARAGITAAREFVEEIRRRVQMMGSGPVG